jgi:hypothetical protein
MAVPIFPSTKLFGPFASNSLTAPTALYIYAIGVSTAEMALLIGWKKKDGTVQDGVFTDWLQGLGVGNDAADLGATVTAELDTDTSSPHYDRVRLNIVVAATQA